MQWPTHEVSNQVPVLQDINLYSSDLALQDGLRMLPREGRDRELAALGAEIGSASFLELADRVNRLYPPVLEAFDRFGNRIDRVEFDAGWHALLTAHRRAGMQAGAWFAPGADAHLSRAAAWFLFGQVESGSMCPTTMTFAAVPVLQKESTLFRALAPKLQASVHDARDLPLPQKQSMMVGMGMTEKQGGSDLRSNSTVARPLAAAGRGEAYLLTGHKWFFSAPMCDAHLVLARTAQGLSCFFVPRWRPDGSKNAVLIQRLKDKLGNRSNSSSEVEFLDAWGLMVGEEGRGIPTIIEMATVTRIDCVIGSAALMRHALVQAIHHARHRLAFGKPLEQQPLMRAVLADLALESEAATHLMLRLASSLDRPEDPLERAWLRVLTPAAKFWICKRAIEFTGEAMEVWGGNGYVETGPMARLYREAPVNSIWEGSGNVMSLDVLRAIEKEPEGFALLMDTISAGAAAHPALAALHRRVGEALRLAPQELESNARRLAQDLVLLVQCQLMLQNAPAPMAEAFLASRLDAAHGRIYGALQASSAVQQAILERAWPSN
ncbi:MAG: isovaleryl-CoA dehydrogenase [Paucimonas sp.]|nr:isovaleryl-CoA dehydrogenase [Paucimonas sp.]